MQVERETRIVERQALLALQQHSLFRDLELELCEKPDIQTKDKSWGIEVVRAIEPRVEEVKRILFEKGKEPKPVPGISIVHEEQSRTRPAKNMSITEYCKSISICMKNTNEFDIALKQIQNKMKKLENGNYDGFEKVGLFVFSPIPETEKELFLPLIPCFEGPLFDIIFFYSPTHYTMMRRVVEGKIWSITKEEMKNAVDFR